MVQKSRTTSNVQNHEIRRGCGSDSWRRNAVTEAKQNFQQAEQLIEDAPDVLAEIAPDDLPPTLIQQQTYSIKTWIANVPCQLIFATRHL